MPSITHEAPIELIRQHPGLAVELLRSMSDVDLPAEIAVSLGPTDLTEVVPIKFLADVLVIVADKATGEPAPMRRRSAVASSLPVTPDST
jgi:hypothetical protein